MQLDQNTETGKLLHSFKKKLTPKAIKEIVSNRDTDGDTKLMLLVIQKHNAFADFIIQQCMDPVLLDTQNDHGQSILHVAVFLKEKELVTRLVSKEQESILWIAWVEIYSTCVPSTVIFKSSKRS